MLKIYNSLHRQKEAFKPIVEGKVSMYVCGMTVYDFCHVGHARVLVVFDVIYRHLLALGYDVRYIRNITDIDDKIITRAAENGESIKALTERFIDAMHEDSDSLGVLAPSDEPKATDNIAEIIAMIETLIEKGFAYQAKNGDVYYSVSSFENYGQLSGKNIDDLQAGARVDVDEGKKDPLDFVLWKTAKPGEPAWESPWGEGRPGWHIECSAMSTKQLGNHFDIHGGGQDLQFPHHENEIAQSEACTGSKYVNYWVHNGFVRINEEKMSKSLGNFFTVRDVLKHIKPEVLRYFILASHYRSPLNYSEENLQNADAAINRLYTALKGVEADTVSKEFGEGYREHFLEAMNDDFNTPLALSVLFEIAGDLNQEKSRDKSKASQLAGLLLELSSSLGCLQEDPVTFLQSSTNENDLQDQEIENLIKLRDKAKVDKDWSESDRIRDELKNSGILLEDGPSGTTWRRTTQLTG